MKELRLGDGQNRWSRYGADARPMNGRISQHETSGEINKSYLPGNFLRNLERGVMARYRSDTRHLCSNVRSRLVQFWFGTDRAIHYEVWIHDRTAQIELGLHFESTPARNRELFRRFDAELLPIQAVLGPTIWLEEWDRGWSRIYETQPLWPLDEARLVSIEDRLAEMIETLQPILDNSSPA